MTWETVATKSVHKVGLSAPIFLKNDNGAHRHRFFVDVSEGSAVVEVSHCPHEAHLNTPRFVEWQPLSIGQLDGDFATEVIGGTAVRLRGIPHEKNGAVCAEIEVMTHA